MRGFTFNGRIDHPARPLGDDLDGKGLSWTVAVRSSLKKETKITSHGKETEGLMRCHEAFHDQIRRAIREDT